MEKQPIFSGTHAQVSFQIFDTHLQLFDVLQVQVGYRNGQTEVLHKVRGGLVEQIPPFVEELLVILPDRAVFKVRLGLVEETVSPVDETHRIAVLIPENMVHLDIVPDHTLAVGLLKQQQRAREHLYQNVLRNRFAAFVPGCQKAVDRKPLDLLTDDEKMGSL